MFRAHKGGETLNRFVHIAVQSSDILPLRGACRNLSIIAPGDCITGGTHREIIPLAVGVRIGNLVAGAEGIAVRWIHDEIATKRGSIPRSDLVRKIGHKLIERVECIVGCRSGV